MANEMDRIGAPSAQPAIAIVSVTGGEAGDMQGAMPAVAAQVQSMGSHIFTVWDAACRARQNNGIDEELMSCARQANAKYSAKEQALIEARGAIPIYIPHADLKRRTSAGLVGEIFLNASDKPFVIDPTPVPDLPIEDAKRLADQSIQEYRLYAKMKLQAEGLDEETAEATVEQRPPDPEVVAEYVRKRRDELDNRRMDEAQRKSERMSKEMEDKMVEGLWHEAMTACVDYAATYGTCILKGPLRKSKKRTRWTPNGLTLKDVEVWEWEAVNPLDAFPSKGAVDINDGDFCQRVRFTAKELNAMKKLGDGYYPNEIDAILAIWPNGGLTLTHTTDSERKMLENDGTAGGELTVDIEGIEFWGDMRGSFLKREGIDKTTDGNAIEDSDYYEVNAIVIDKRVVFCTLTDERFGRPLYKGVFYRTPGSWWGESPMKKMRDADRMYQAAARDLCVNMAHASGPMMVVHDAKRIPPGTDLKVIPWSIMPFNDPLGRGDKPFTMFQATSNAQELIQTMREFEKIFDTVTGIPAYSHGSDTAAGAGRTYQGLLLIVTASKQGANNVVFSLFNDVMKPALTYLYRLLLMFSDDEGIKGDCEVKAGGLLAILMREQSLSRLQEFLNLANNPAVQRIIGDSGMAELLRKYMSLLQGINPDKVVPSESEMEKRQQLAEIQAKMQAAEAMAMQATATREAIGQTEQFGSGGVASREPMMAPPSQPPLPPIPPPMQAPGGREV